MKIAVIDADLIGRKKHRFPNLTCMKISGYYKSKNADVVLKMDYDNLEQYDDVFIAKVFTDTPFPDWIKPNEKIHIGGTGFYFDKAPNLPYEIEHFMPDYHLYDEWVESEISKGLPSSQFTNYVDYSIGFTTRGCFRKCPFCVNQKYDKVFEHSKIAEFYDESRKKICLLDDNILGYAKNQDVFSELIATGKPFVFKQGMDERLLTDEKCKMLFSAKYDGDYIFAFDNVKDYELIESKLKIINKYKQKKTVKFYVLVGFEGTDAEDIANAFKRIELLFKYGCIPHLMRYQSKTDAPYKHSKYSGIYTNMARWCNQVSFVKKKSFRDFCEADQAYQSRNTNKTSMCASMKALKQFEEEHPEIAKRYFDIKFNEVKKNAD